MVDERKGILTPEQEDIVEKAVRFKNPVLELVDGPVIKTVDNVFLEKLMTFLEGKYPEYVPYIYEAIDVVCESIKVE